MKKLMSIAGAAALAFFVLAPAVDAAITTDNKTSHSARKLLKTIVKTGYNNTSATITDGEEELTDTKTTVRCPEKTRCLIEVQVVLEWEIDSSPGTAYQVVKIDGTDVTTNGGALGGATGTGLDSVWTRARNVGAGNHIVQVYAGAVGAQKFWGYSVVIRLYKR
jgi:hypothetical protein